MSVVESLERKYDTNERVYHVSHSTNTHHHKRKHKPSSKSKKSSKHQRRDSKFSRIRSEIDPTTHIHDSLTRSRTNPSDHPPPIKREVADDIEYEGDVYDIFPPIDFDDDRPSSTTTTSISSASATTGRWSTRLRPKPTKRQVAIRCVAGVARPSMQIPSDESTSSQSPCSSHSAPRLASSSVSGSCHSSQASTLSFTSTSVSTPSSSFSLSDNFDTFGMHAALMKSRSQHILEFCSPASPLSSSSSTLAPLLSSSARSSAEFPSPASSSFSLPSQPSAHTLSPSSSSHPSSTAMSSAWTRRVHRIMSSQSEMSTTTNTTTTTTAEDASDLGIHSSTNTPQQSSSASVTATTTFTMFASTNLKNIRYIYCAAGKRCPKQTRYNAQDDNKTRLLKNFSKHYTTYSPSCGDVMKELRQQHHLPATASTLLRTCDADGEKWLYIQAKISPDPASRSTASLPDSTVAPPSSSSTSSSASSSSSSSKTSSSSTSSSPSVSPHSSSSSSSSSSCSSSSSSASVVSSSSSPSFSLVSSLYATSPPSSPLVSSSSSSSSSSSLSSSSSSSSSSPLPSGPTTTTNQAVAKQIMELLQLIRNLVSHHFDKL